MDLLARLLIILIILIAIILLGVSFSVIGPIIVGVFTESIFSIFSRFSFSTTESSTIIENLFKGTVTSIAIANNNGETGEIRTILIVGNTGNGKSTLANVLLGEEGKFTEVPGSTSGTERIQRSEFVWNGHRYRVIDTIGLEDTNLSNEKIRSIFNGILSNLGTILKRDNIKILFVFKDRFTENQMKAFGLFDSNCLVRRYNLLSNFIIVSTNFPCFRDNKKCKEDIEKLLEKNKKITETIRKCKIIHVDNPPLEYGDNARNNRKDSRQKLLDHLESSFNWSFV